MSASGGGLLNRAINALPFELYIPGYQFCGPSTRLTKRLVRGDASITWTQRVENIAYSRSNDLTDRHATDKILADKALGRVTARDSALSERTAAAVWEAMKAKSKIGMSMKLKKKMTTRKKTMKKRILSTAKRSGALFFLPILDALESLIGEVASVAKRL